MNFVYLSPHFPPNYYQFCVHLNQLGVNVLGLADEPFNYLRDELKDSLSEYYWVNDMHNYEELLRALGYFTHHYGKIDRIDSHNEYWLETEARLRTDFNIFGIKNYEIDRIKRKSQMKKVFVKAGVQVARGRIVRDIRDARRLISETGFPVVAKPDKGVGAAQTYKIHDEEELISFFVIKPSIDFIMEEYIQGEIETFDGLTDQDGTLVFFTSHKYNQGIMETINDDSNVYYYSLRKVPADLEETGKRVLKAFDVRERFFHFEFFRNENNRIVALEVNIRPPGGMTTDMFNFANDIDIYKEWANVVVHNKFTTDYNRKYHCCYIGRKFNRNYVYSHDQVVAAFRNELVHHEKISGVFSVALGDYGYLVRSPELDEVHQMAAYIHKTVLRQGSGSNNNA